jgi:hypothetical protein
MSDIEQQIMGLYQAGMPIKAIGKKLGVGDRKVTEVCKEAGIYKGHSRRQGGGIVKEQSYKLPDLIEDDLPFEELLKKQLIPNTQKKIAHKNQFKWMKVRVNHHGPFVYVAQGDQHLDDPYCNLDLFYKHVNLWRGRDDVLVLPMGDLHNNWVGRLEKLYSSQDMSRDRAYKAIEWFFNEAGLSIPVALAGNHDSWNMGIKILSGIVPAETVLLDWRAQFAIVLPNGREVLIDAAHDHKGSSIYNALHGQKRAAMTGVKAHAFIGAHRHTPGFMKDWHPEEQAVCWYIRPGSYKWFDQHAVTNGFANYQDAPAMAMIIDPDTENHNPIIQVTDDMELALDVLDFLKKKRGVTGGKQRRK